MRSLSPGSAEQIERPDAETFVIVKAQPRSYATSTIPTCQIALEVTALGRADSDPSGGQTADARDALMAVYENWQKCMDDTHADFTVPGEFECTGYRLDGGSFQLNQSDKIWQYSHSMTVFGVVQ